MTTLIEWGHNPGQRFVKDSLTIKGKRRDLRPYAAVIAPWAASDDTGLGRKTKELTARVGDRHYIGGDAAERLPLANRQQAKDRLDPESPIYAAFAQMSAQHAGLATFQNGSRPQVLIATALPVAWKLDDETAAAHLEGHIRRALSDTVLIKAIVVQSEPNALVSSELLDDDGQARVEQRELATDLICVGDIGGGTANRTVLEKLRALPGQSASPDLGSSQVVRDLAQRSGMQYVDAERRLERAVAASGHDPVADRLLKQYREAVISDFQQAWKIFPSSALRLFGGGTVHWLAAELPRVWARCRIVSNPQQAIAIGLWRYARRKARRGA